MSAQIKKPIVTVLGATGNIGNHLLPLLIQQDFKVRAITRNQHAKLTNQGQDIESVAVDLLDTESLTNALRGSEVVFAMIPPKYDAADFRGYQNLVGDSLARAIKNAGVVKVVNLSSIGAHLSTGTGPILGLADQEARLNQLVSQGVASVVHLRPAYFFENIGFGLSTIEAHGVFGTPIRRNQHFAQVATRDIAARAAQIIGGLVHSKMHSEQRSSRVIELVGPEDYNMQDVTTALGEQLQRANLPYVEFAPEDARQAMVSAGLSPDVAQKFLDLYAAINSGKLTPANPSLVVHGSTSFRQFVGQFLQKA